MVVYLRILPEDKAEARYISPSDCPIARAMNRILKPELCASVGSVDVHIRKRQDWKYGILHTVELPGDSGHEKQVYKHRKRVTRIRVEIPKIYLA